jgi:hypothetical protein
MSEKNGDAKCPAKPANRAIDLLVESVSEKVRHRAECLRCLYRNKNNDCFASQNADCALACSLLKVLSEHGVVRLADDQTLPENPYAGLDEIPSAPAHRRVAYGECLNSLKAAGWVKILPFIRKDITNCDACLGKGYLDTYVWNGKEYKYYCNKCYSTGKASTIGKEGE